MTPEDFILDGLDSIGQVDFALLIKFLLVSTVVFWFFVVFWVWTDSRERSRNLLFSIASVFLVAPFNVLGLLVYLLIRPRDTVESLFWTDLERRYLIHETADLGDCAECGYQLSPEFNVCPQCSTPCKIACPSCEVMVRTDWKFCPSCSHQLLSRRVPEKEITQEIMEKNIEETREQAFEAVENNRIRYKERRSVLAKIGRPVVRSIMRFGKFIDNAVRSFAGGVRSGAKRLKRKGLASRAINYSANFAELSSGESYSNDEGSHKKSKKKKKKKKRR